MLDAFGISVSTGSACSSKSLVPSHVLEAIGISITKMNGTVRFTVGDFTTKEDIDYVVETLVKVVARLRELSPVNGTGRMVDNMALYNDKVMDHFLNPHNVGEIENR